MGSGFAPRYLDVDGRRTRYAVTGEGPALVLLHGLGRSLEDWFPVQGALARDHTVYSIDLAGFGESDRLPARTDLPSLADSIAAFLDSVGEPGPIRLAGNYLGGAVALQFTVNHPERVAALILVDSAGFGREVTLGLRVLAIPGLGRLLLRPSRLTAPVRARSVFHDRSLATRERIDLQYRLASRPGAADAFLEISETLGDWRGVRPEWGRELVSRVEALGIPALLLWGKRDRILPARHLEAARAALPHAEVHAFADAGHMPQIEAPDEFVDVVSRFLARMAPDPGRS